MNNLNLWVQEKLGSLSDLTIFEIKNPETLKTEVILSFEVFHGKLQIEFDFLFADNIKNNLDEVLTRLNLIKDLYPGYVLISKTDANDGKKLDALDLLTFNTTIELVDLRRDIDATSDVVPTLPDGLQFRLLDPIKELDLWYQLTIEGYSGAPEFRGFDFNYWKKLVLDESGALNPVIPADGVVVLELDGNPVGIFVMDRQEKSSLDGHSMTLGVLPQYRGRGFAELLMRWSLAYEASRGSVRSNLLVNSGNSAAMALYKKLGYTVDRLNTVVKKYN